MVSLPSLLLRVLFPSAESRSSWLPKESVNNLFGWLLSQITLSSHSSARLLFPLLAPRQLVAGRSFLPITISTDSNCSLRTPVQTKQRAEGCLLADTRCLGPGAPQTPAPLPLCSHRPQHPPHRIAAERSLLGEAPLVPTHREAKGLGWWSCQPWRSPLTPCAIRAPREVGRQLQERERE